MACMYAVLNLNYTPSAFAGLPQKEKAFVIACINLRIEEEQKRAKEIKARKR